MAEFSRSRQAEPQKRLTSRIGQLCSALREILNARRVTVLLYDAKGQALSPLLGDDVVDEHLIEVSRKWARIPLNSFPAAQRALLEQVPVVIEDTQRDDRLPPGLAADFGTTSLHLEPLATSGPVGLLAIEPATAAVNGELRAIVPLVAASAARAVPREEAPEATPDKDFVLELMEAAAGERTLEGALRTLSEHLARRLGARRAFAFMAEDGTLVPKVLVRSRDLPGADADASNDDEEERQRFRAAPAPLPLAEAALASSQVEATEASGSPAGGWWGEAFGLGSALAAPIGSGPEAMGVVVVEDDPSRQFTEAERELLASAGEHVAPIVARARELEERTSHLEAATAVRRLLEGGARVHSVEEAADLLAGVARDALGTPQTSVFLIDPEERISYAWLDLPERFDALVRERIIGAQAGDFRLWRRVVRHRKPIFVEDARDSQLIPPEIVALAGLRSYVAFPLLSEERPLGLVICSDTGEPRRWTEEQRRLVDQLALEGSLVIENAALRESERERLGELARQAFHDPLTDLPNRALFADRLDHALARLRRRHGSVAVLLLDLDGFKEVNDTLGHEAGDQLLVTVGERLRGCLRPADTIARLGGDEFTILLEEIDSLREATRVAERIEDALKTPFVLNGNEIAITTSIGIALNTPGNSEPDDLLRNADTAMYRAKRAGKARYDVFEPPPNPAGSERIDEEGTGLSIKHPGIAGPRQDEQDTDGNGSPLAGQAD